MMSLLRRKKWAEISFEKNLGGEIYLLPAGVIRAEEIMEKTYAEEERLVLKKILELGKSERGGQVPVAKLQKSVSHLITLPLFEIIDALDKKDFLGPGQDDCVKIGTGGLELLQKQSNRSGGFTVNNTINAGPNSNIAIGDNNQQSISQSVNPDFNESINAIAEVIKASAMSDSDKRIAHAELEEIVDCYIRKDKEKGRYKVLSLDNFLKVAGIAAQFIQHTDKLVAAFDSLR